MEQINSYSWNTRCIETARVEHTKQGLFGITYPTILNLSQTSRGYHLKR